MQLLVCVGREASCLTGWQETVGKEIVSRTTSPRKFFRYLLKQFFIILHFAVIPCLKTANMLYHLLNELQNLLTRLQKDCPLG